MGALLVKVKGAWHGRSGVTKAPSNLGDIRLASMRPRHSSGTGRGSPKGPFPTGLNSTHWQPPGTPPALLSQLNMQGEMCLLSRAPLFLFRSARGGVLKQGLPRRSGGQQCPWRGLWTCPHSAPGALSRVLGSQCPGCHSKEVSSPCQTLSALVNDKHSESFLSFKASLRSPRP